MAAQSKETWAKIRDQFEAGVSIPKLAEEFKVSRSAIIKHRDKKGWIKGDGEQIVDQLTSDTLMGVAGVTDVTQRAHAFKTVAEERVELIKSHRQEWKELDRLSKEIHQCLYDAKYKPAFWEDWTVKEWDYQKLDKDGHPTPKLKEFKPFDGDERMRYAKQLQHLHRARSEALMTKQEGERRSHGFDYKMQIAEGQETDSRHTERVKTVKGLLELADEFTRSQKPQPTKQGNLE